MSRRLKLVLALAGACASFPAAALATDDPPPPPGATPPPAGGVLGVCTDHSPPRVRLSTTSTQLSHKLMLRGSSSDAGCGAAGAGKVAQVTVSIDRKSGNRCRFLSRSHHLTRARSCKKPVWLTVKGTTSWSYKLPRKLSHGRYQVAVRAVDSSGNVATTSKRALKLR
jgi:hypothetical protein